MSRKKRVDSPVVQQHIIQKALSSEVSIPEFIKLRDCDIPFWEVIVRARAKSEWKQHELVLAAQLARCQADIEEEQSLLYLEGTTIVNHKGTTVTNPRFGAINQLKMGQLSILKALALHTGSGTTKRDIDKRDAIAKATESKVDDIGMDDGDSLIARPTLQ